jgi:hypothetical protein
MGEGLGERVENTAKLPFSLSERGPPSPQRGEEADRVRLFFL